MRHRRAVVATLRRAQTPPVVLCHPLWVVTFKPYSRHARAQSPVCLAPAGVLVHEPALQLASSAQHS